MPTLFDAIQDLARTHSPLEETWSSLELRDILNGSAYPASFNFGSANWAFNKALYNELARRTLKDLEVRRLYFAAIQCRSIQVVGWLRKDFRRKGALGCLEIAELLREHTWTEEQIILFFDWLLFFQDQSETNSHLSSYLLSWPDQHFLRLFSRELKSNTEYIIHDSLWMYLFINEGLNERLLSILSQIPPSARSHLTADACIYLISKDANRFTSFVESTGRAYLHEGYLRDAFETYEILREKRPSDYQDEMAATCLAILASDDGDTQLADAATTLLHIKNKDALQPVLQWSKRPFIPGPGPFTGAPGGGRGSALYYATAHVGPESFPLLESALAKRDIDLMLDCLRCWMQFEYPDTDEFVVSQLSEIVSNVGIDQKQRHEALEIGVEWNILLLEPLLLACLHDKHAAIRTMATRALGRMGDKHWTTALEMLRSRKATVRSTAILLLETLATPAHRDEVFQLCSQEKNSNQITLWETLLSTLESGSSLPPNAPPSPNASTASPKPLFRGYKYKKVPPLHRTDGTAVTEFDLHRLFLCQWRSGRQRLAAEAETMLMDIDAAELDSVAHYLWSWFHLPPWLLPLIAHMSGDQSLSCFNLAHSQQFTHRRVSEALSIVKTLNTIGGKTAQERLAGYQKCYPWFARLPWPGLDSGDLFKATYKKDGSSYGK